MDLIPSFEEYMAEYKDTPPQQENALEKDSSSLEGLAILAEAACSQEPSVIKVSKLSGKKALSRLNITIKAAKRSVDPPTPPESPVSSFSSISPVSPVSPGTIVPPKHIKRTLIYDWDDTLFPMKHLLELGINVFESQLIVDPVHKKEIEDHDKLLVSYFRQVSILYPRGPFFLILTNGSDQWVQRSAAVYLPQMAAFLYQSNVRIISARSAKEWLWPETVPDVSYLWKYHTLLDHFEELNLARYEEHHLISVGDSPAEQRAVQALADVLPGPVYCKTIKLQVEPTLKQLQLQLAEITLLSYQLANTPKSFHISLEERVDPSTF